MPSHREQRTIPFRSSQMFDLVADVARYPEFLPWCVGARVRSRSGTQVVADLMIGYRLVRERFTSRVSLDRAGGRIDVVYAEGPFRYLESHWRFSDTPDGCLIDFHVDFEFRSMVLQKIISTLFTEAVHRMVAAFENRAHAIYGQRHAGPAPGGVTHPASG
ncbi:MAG: type II toxin-antitoxin system RatA family toxin [Alphaproteobacteria bacterium]|nr:type II toxin-antitoxin system RatA family toxin [Alphaproteobacteria bacterium]